MTQDYCVSIHDSFCSLESCKFHLLLIGKSLSQNLQKLDNYQNKYQEIDCLYTLYKHGYYSSVITSSGEVFNKQIFSVQHHHRWKGATRNTKRIKEKIHSVKVQKTYLSSNQKTCIYANSALSFFRENLKNSKHKN